MANPNSLSNGQGDEIDLIVQDDGTAVLKAAGRTIVAGGAADPSAPQLVTDSTMLTGHGYQVVAAGPTAEALRPTNTPCRRVTVKAHVDNVNTLYVGLEDVTADDDNLTGGFQLSPGEAFTFGVDDAALVFIHGTAGEGASFAYEL